jgi:N-acyl-D-aspartate/D-glutamate deacylase
MDAVIRNAVVVDGTGAAPFAGSVGVQDGRVAQLGDVDDSGSRILDADGLVVAPGFIDIHTHYDAQAFWDPTLSPSPLHGVTTVIGGNCGFSIAPLCPEDGNYLMRMLGRVEGMPVASLQQGVPWDWSTTAEYLDRLEGTLTPNAGFLVGHSALRKAVMHDDAGEKATPEQIAGMCSLLADGLRAGGLGFSSSWAASHNDHLGQPVPSRAADLEELLALCRVAGEYPGTTLEFILGIPPYSEDLFEAMTLISLAANRPLIGK